MKQKIIDLMKTIVGTKSIYPHELTLGRKIEELFKKNGYKTTRQFIDTNRFNVLVEKGTGKKSILLYSHLDTIDINEGWKTDPLKLKIIGDKAFGLGSWDMKGGMTSNILSFLNYQPKNYKLKMAFCVDEEYISKGGHALIKSDFMKDVDCVISTEPSFFYGNQGIVIGRPGRAVFEVDITGKPNHYAFYSKSVDINFFVSGLTKKLGSLYKKQDDKKQFVFIRKIASETIGMSTPHKVKLELDSSIIPPNTNNKIKNEIENIANKINAKFSNYFNIKVDFIKRDTPFLESYEIKKNNQYLDILSKSVKKITKKVAISYFRSSIADENIFGSSGKTVLSIGPIGNNAHSPNEWVSIESLEKLYRITSNFLTEIDFKK